MRPHPFLRRIQGVVAGLAAHGLDQLVVSSLPNIRWLTGFTGSNAMVLVTADRLLLATDGRYEEHAQGCLDHLSALGYASGQLLVLRSDVVAEFARVAPPEGVVGFESAIVSVAGYRGFVDAYGESRLSPAHPIIEEARQFKDAGEVERIEAAADIADAAFAEISERLAPGQTEQFVAATLNYAMLTRGADGLSFDTIVAAGAHGALPHAQPSARELAVGDLVVFDFGAAVDGYGSDMTRTVVIGGQATTRQRELYEVVLAAQQAGFEGLGDGVEAAAIDRICRSSITKAGYGDAFIHGTGHSLGLEIHENPFLSATSTAVLQTGMVVTVEPGIYLPGECGIRIEDTCVLSEGGPRRLTKASKEL